MTQDAMRKSFTAEETISFLKKIWGCGDSTAANILECLESQGLVISRKAAHQSREAEVKMLREALETAENHIEHMAAWITKQNAGYSFESLGEDMTDIRALTQQRTVTMENKEWIENKQPHVQAACHIVMHVLDVYHRTHLSKEAQFDAMVAAVIETQDAFSPPVPTPEPLKATGEDVERVAFNEWVHSISQSGELESTLRESVGRLAWMAWNHRASLRPDVENARLREAAEIAHKALLFAHKFEIGTHLEGSVGKEGEPYFYANNDLEYEIDVARIKLGQALSHPSNAMKESE